MTKSLAAVLREAGGRLTFEEIELASLAPNEIRIAVKAVGICHTDLSAIDGTVPLPLPVVLGHEGTGVVQEIGEQVVSIEVGDHVAVSFDSCGECAQCKNGSPAYCEVFAALNYFGTRLDGSTTMQCCAHGAPVHGNWFGQSTFATQAIISERNAVKLPKDVPIELMGPLGCGIQTGAGTVFNVLKPRPGQSIAIFGMGAVGLSALMAARIAGCTTMIAVDTNPARLQIAKELGATHLFNPQECSDIVWQIMDEVSPGVDYPVDCVGSGEVIRNALMVLRTPGTCATLGLKSLENDITIDQGHLLQGRTLAGVIEGNADPKIFIPQLIELWKSGQFPFDRFCKTFAMIDIEKAILSTRNGDVVKPIIVMA